jgi:hypothetical protein
MMFNEIKVAAVVVLQIQVEMEVQEQREQEMVAMELHHLSQVSVRLTLVAVAALLAIPQM